MKRSIALILCLVLVLALAGCSKTVQVDITGLKNVTSNGAETGKTKEDYTLTLTPAQNYEMPTAVTVTMEDAVLTEGYTYDPATGTLTIAGDSITGDFAIAAEARESIVGTFEGALDFAAVLMEMLTLSDPESAEYFDLHDLSVTIGFTFRDDGTCTMYFDEASMEAIVEPMTQQLVDSFYSMLEAVIAEQEIEMSVEDFLDVSNISLDTLVDEMSKQLLSEETLKEMTQEYNYKREDAKLYLSDEKPEDMTEEDANGYTLVNGTLTIEAPVEEDEDSQALINAMFPMTLKRVG